MPRSTIPGCWGADEELGAPAAVGRQSGAYAAALVRKHEEERIQYDPTYVRAFFCFVRAQTRLDPGFRTLPEDFFVRVG